ncbi:hypothetical protein [Paraburkholderia unamae]|uniref:hypothetical protein n=1 Tax=Paraburkholderia unamae TaxID=219649 RepID=UPI0021AC99F0|nr:hypothetical protein [Paraburkholderia unamae]
MKVRRRNAEVDIERVETAQHAADRFSRKREAQARIQLGGIRLRSATCFGGEQFRACECNFIACRLVFVQTLRVEFARDAARAHNGKHGLVEQPAHAAKHGVGQREGFREGLIEHVRIRGRSTRCPGSKGLKSRRVPVRYAAAPMAE